MAGEGGIGLPASAAELASVKKSSEILVDCFGAATTRLDVWQQTLSCGHHLAICIPSNGYTHRRAKDFAMEGFTKEDWDFPKGVEAGGLGMEVPQWGPGEKPR